MPFKALPKGMFAIDEPFVEGDALDRDRYAQTLARLAAGCDTPMVIGLYGTWGAGKSSLMRRIQGKLSDEKVPTVWFDPWQHQFDEDPVVALLQTMVSQLRSENVEEFKAALAVIGLALGSWAMKAFTGLEYKKDLKEMIDTVEAENFRIRDQRVRLRQTIEKLIANVRGRKNRIVFFIDDLDRCVAKNVVRMLEALKLYLNAKGCVYFLGIDHTTVKAAIEKEHPEYREGNQSYLDKIVQLPFLIPRIGATTSEKYIEKLLPETARSTAERLVPFLGDNPRQVKRFVNVLSLNLLMAEDIPGIAKPIGVDLVATILLIQVRNEGLWRRLSANPRLFRELQQKPQEGKADDPAATILRDYFGGDTQLQGLVQRTPVDKDEQLAQYLLLAGVAGASVRAETTLAIEPEMVELPAGSFPMGSPDKKSEKDKSQFFKHRGTEEDWRGLVDGDADEGPYREVTVQGFAIGRYPVTFAEYDAFCEATERKPPSDNGWGRGRTPAINVSWDDAQDYAKWLSEETGKTYRLPSEAEWEYACRAGTVANYWWGNWEPTEPDANFGGNVGRTTEVGQYPKNPWGLYDMHGNVWEWVEDVWHEVYDDAPTDGSPRMRGGNENVRVLRGGSWDGDPRVLRSASRFWSATVFRSLIVGFRVARTIS